ncbi:MAG TPA: hypothetical protein VGB92_03515 [Longimicrobium sp.]|jgi:alpha-tubulin suppressor-like RCC1 family protein
MTAFWTNVRRVRTHPLFLVLACAVALACDQPTEPRAIDATAPEIEVSRALGPVAHSVQEAEVQAVVRDSVGVKRIAYRVNEGAEQPVEVRGGPEVQVRFRVPLTGIWNVVKVYAYDAAGNVGEATTVVTHDDGAAPTLTRYAPRADTVSNRGIRFVVEAKDSTGVAEITLSVNGGAATPMKSDCLGEAWEPTPCGRHGERRGWSSTLSAAVPGANTLRVTARDSVGNEATATWTLNLVPTVALRSPAAAAEVTGDSMRVEGTATFVEPVVRLGIQVNGGPVRNVTVAPAASVPFALSAPLEDAGNVVTIHAYDAAGNTGRMAVSVVRSARAAGTGPWASVEAGGGHSCALTKAGVAYCWGDNAYGQLGTGDLATRAAPSPVAGGHTFASLATGYQHSCGVTTAGAALCWGKNDMGQLGNGGSANASVPTPVSGGRAFVRVEAGTSFTCGLTAGGAVYCWGIGEGVGAEAATCTMGAFTRFCSPTPVLASGTLAFRAMDVGSSHVCALTEAGAAYCWGYNYFGVVGDGTRTDARTPVAVKGGLAFRSISAGSISSCGVTAAGKGYCWGVNLYGELGTGTYPGNPPNGPYTPDAVAFERPWAIVETGGAFTCGVAAGSGAGYCWGEDYPNQQLGRGKIDYALRISPGPVLGGISFARIAPGGGYACGLSTGGAVYCWGAGQQGQLGYGQRSNSAFPVRVVDP